jgi:solute carrier family 35 protein C2
MFATDRLDFRFPIFTTSLHQLVQFSLALLLTKDNSVLTFVNLKRALACAAASTGDIGMGNVSLRAVTLSFYTMVKSSSLGFVLLFGILFRLERATWQIAAIVTVMSIGVIMMVAGETQFVLVGFFLVLGAAACSGLRWALTQILLRSADAQVADSCTDTDNGTMSDIEVPAAARHRRLSTSSCTSHHTLDNAEGGPLAVLHHDIDVGKTTPHHHHPLQTMLLLSPSMFVLLFILAMVIEGPVQLVHAKLWTDMGVGLGILVLLFPGTLAFCMTLSEFILLNRTSVLTLAIAGICKEVVTITAAVIFFGDRLTAVNGIGLVVTTSAILAYQRYRFGS